MRRTERYDLGLIDAVRRHAALYEQQRRLEPREPCGRALPCPAAGQHAGRRLARDEPASGQVAELLHGVLRGAGANRGGSVSMRRSRSSASTNRRTGRRGSHPPRLRVQRRRIERPLILVLQDYQGLDRLHVGARGRAISALATLLSGRSSPALRSEQGGQLVGGTRRCRMRRRAERPDRKRVAISAKGSNIPAE